MDVTQWLNPLSAVLVLAGTLAAVLLRCGWHDLRETVRAAAVLARKPFAVTEVRAELAVQIQEIDEDGLVRAHPHHFGDGEFDAVADALIRRRSLAALHEEHDKHRAARLARAETATGVLGQAAELAPVVGLAGTLLSLGSLSAAVAAGGDATQAIGLAVTTTLYGLVLANFVFAPLAAAIARRSRVEEGERQALLDWLEEAVRDACSAPTAAPQARSRAA